MPIDSNWVTHSFEMKNICQTKTKRRTIELSIESRAVAATKSRKPIEKEKMCSSTHNRVVVGDDIVFNF